MGQFSRNLPLGHFPLGKAGLSIALVISFFTSYDANALSLDPVLNTVDSVTRAIRGESKDVKKSSPASSASERSAGSPQSPKDTSPTPSSTVSNSGTTPPKEEMIMTEPLQELPTIDAPAVAEPTSHSPRSIPATTASTEVLGAQSTTTPLRATDQGWEVFGIAWYWLAMVFASAWGGLIYLRNYYISLSRYRLLPVLLRASESMSDA